MVVLSAENVELVLSLMSVAHAAARALVWCAATEDAREATRTTAARDIFLDMVLALDGEVVAKLLRTYISARRKNHDENQSFSSSYGNGNVNESIDVMLDVVLDCDRDVFRRVLLNLHLVRNFNRQTVVIDSKAVML